LNSELKVEEPSGGPEGYKGGVEDWVFVVEIRTVDYRIA